MKAGSVVYNHVLVPGSGSSRKDEACPSGRMALGVAPHLKSNPSFDWNIRNLILVATFWKLNKIIPPASTAALDPSMSADGYMYVLRIWNQLIHPSIDGCPSATNEYLKYLPTYLPR